MLVLGIPNCHPDRVTGEWGQTMTEPDIRTAVVMVHGMGEQVPLETVNQFVKTALPRTGKPPRRQYFSRPDVVSGSYEARKMVAYAQAYRPDAEHPRVHDHFDFYEYHWSYKMTGNRLGDFLPTLWRLLWRRPSTRPDGLRVIWLIAWGVILILFALFVWFLVARTAEQDISVANWLAFVLGVAIGLPGAALLASVVMWVLNLLGNKVTSYFVDVVRYLDNSPRSYAVRRDIRDGMVSLLRGIHESGRYQRVVVVAHSLGGYIAYDGLTSLWSEYHTAHCGPIQDDALPAPQLAGREEVQKAGRALRDAAEKYRWEYEQPKVRDAVPDDVRPLVDAYRAAQFAFWRGLRAQGSPWLVTDFITLGTPMYFADLLVTRNREQFRELVHRAELPVCPPIPRSQMVETEEQPDGEVYCSKELGRWVPYHAAPFAAVRWTNLYFPAEKGFWGDWFGGPLRGLFGPGVLDVPVLGNVGGHAPKRGSKDGYSHGLTRRTTPGAAHGFYFSFAEEDTRPKGGNPPTAPDGPPVDIAPLLRHYLGLTMEPELRSMLPVPKALGATYPVPRTNDPTTAPDSTAPVPPHAPAEP
jgi:hypothetical protein